MKHRLPILPGIALGVVVAVVAGLLAARTRAGGEAASEPPATVAGVAPGDLLRRAAEQLARHDSIATKVRFRSNLFGQSLHGTGQFLQDRYASRRVRFELKTQLGDKISSVQQVADGEALWIRHTTLAGSQLTRIDVRRVLDALAVHDSTHPAAQPAQHLALGGLPMLIESLTGSFDFPSVKPDQLGRLNVLVVTGTWKPAALAKLVPEEKERIESGAALDPDALPVYVPSQVQVYLGRDDLFPYKIDYQRKVTSAIYGDELRTMASIEFFEVRLNAPLDRVQFSYQPGDAIPVDETEKFIQRLLGE
ncbi:MAG: hypothetical protein HYX69_13560 [Planctomycetia bacterium]|nr:hypothetical protein [Planctomycetia bacterium]